MQTWYPLVLRYKRVIKGTKFCVEVNLPGTEDTVINQAVPPGSGIALSRVEASISPNVGGSGAQFLVVGDRACTKSKSLI